MATGTAVGSSSIAVRMKRTVFWTKHGDTRQTRSLWASWPAAPAGRARARRQRLEMYAEELVAIADHAARGTSHPEAINQARLRTDTRKWVLSKLLPETYGNRVKLTGDLEVPPRNRKVIEFVHTQPPPPDTSNSLRPLNSSKP